MEIHIANHARLEQDWILTPKNFPAKLWVALYRAFPRLVPSVWRVLGRAVAAYVRNGTEDIILVKCEDDVELSAVLAHEDLHIALDRIGERTASWMLDVIDADDL